MAVPSQEQRLEYRLNVAQDVIAAIGLVTGIAVATLSLWALISKYRAAGARQRQQQP